MALYEHIFMARQDLSTQQVDSLIQQYKGVVEAEGGSVGRVENLGLKTLAYRIQKNRKAHYVMLNLDAPASAITELERQLRINEDILRFLTVRVEEHEEGPSVFLSKKDRDDSNHEDGRRNHQRNSSNFNAETAKEE